MNESPLMSRALIGGKKTAKFEARVSEDLKEAASRKWHDDGFASESEYIEALVAVNVFGFEHVRMIQERRLARVCGLSENAQAAA